MPSQTDFEKVTTCVIRPLERLYGKSFATAEINDYVDSLARYSEQSLHDAMVEIRENETRRPTLAHVVQAAKKFSSKGDNGGSSYAEKIKAEQDARYSRIRTAANDYTNSFCYQNRERLDRLPEWQRKRMIECVHQAAKLQAQWIEGVKNAGYSVAPWMHPNESNREERMNWWLEMCREAAKAGAINVTAPWLWYEQKEAA